MNAELNPICYLLALLGAHHILHVSRVRVKVLSASGQMRARTHYLFIQHPGCRTARNQLSDILRPHIHSYPPAVPMSLCGNRPSESRMISYTYWLVFPSKVHQLKFVNKNFFGDLLASHQFTYSVKHICPSQIFNLVYNFFPLKAEL